MPPPPRDAVRTAGLLTAGWLAAAGPAAGQPPLHLPTVPFGGLPPLAAPAAPPVVPPDGPPDAAKATADGGNGNGNGEAKKDGPAAPDDDPDTAAFRAAPAGTPLALGECLALALAHQPAVAAADHSLAAAKVSRVALDDLSRLAELVSPDVPVRRRQADRGVAVAAAEVHKVRNEAVYDVTRLYWTYVYARQQEQTADTVIDQMVGYFRVAEDIVNSGLGGRKVNQFTLYALQDAIAEVRKLRVTAVAGRNSALQALREAMGVGPELAVVPKDTELPVMAGTVTRDQVVAAALGRRPELAQAAAGVDAFRLEIDAQYRLRYRPSAATFASGSDIHSRPVPLPNRNGEYKPGAVPPEMPPNLAGGRDLRVARAAEFSRRQEAVFDKTRNLVRLEAENAYLAFAAAVERRKEAKRKLDNATRLVDESRAAAATRQEPDLLARNEALAGKAQAEYLEAVFDHLKSLATLERVTAGGVCPAFPGR